MCLNEIHCLIVFIGGVVPVSSRTSGRVLGKRLTFSVTRQRMAVCSAAVHTKFQMKQWLEKFCNKGILRIIVIGDRKSLGSPFLEHILGWSSESCSDLSDKIELFQIKLTREVAVRVGRVPALSDADGYKDERYVKSVAKFKPGVAIYCIDMSDTRLRGSVLRTFQALKTDWSRTVIALTFADALPDLVRHQGTKEFAKVQHIFNAKVAEWTRELQAIFERIGIQQEVKVYPCASAPEDLLPNGEPWLAPLSLAIMEILSPKKKAEFLKKHAELLPTVAAIAKQPPALPPTVAAPPEAPLAVSETTEVQLCGEGDLQVDSAVPSLSQYKSSLLRVVLSKLRKDCPQFGVLIIGRTGVGKSTLINNLLGKEVASVGHTLQSETPEVYQHESSVEGVSIVVYDTPGLGDIKGEEEEEIHLDIIQSLLKEGKIHLILYCFQMNQTIMSSSLVGTLKKYKRIGVDWKRTVIALTFADALYASKSEQDCSYFKMSLFFDDRLAFLQRELRKELVERVGVQSGVAERLKICPTALLPKDILPNGNPWYVPLWLDIVEIMSPAETLRFLDIHRKNICDDQASPLNKDTNNEVKLVGDDKTRFTNMFLAKEAKTDSSEMLDALKLLTTASEKFGVRAVCKLINDTLEQAMAQLPQSTAGHTTAAG